MPLAPIHGHTPDEGIGMDDQPTCGKGLAEHSALPAKLGELIASMAENLEIHRQSLDSNDENSRKEHDAYVKLAKELRSIAAQLQATAKHMDGYRDLPMGRHDEQALADPKVHEAFATLVRLEQELLALLAASLQRDEQMLVAMHGQGHAAGGAMSSSAMPAAQSGHSAGSHRS
jgi:formiminotetrahydrofolate cyclodeaminase